MKYTELFNDRSDIYASARPRYPAQFYRHLSTLCPEASVVWDCGCGNGQSAIDLANYFEQILATDISANQIENAFAHPRVNYSVTPSEQTGFADQQFDLVCVAQALHWMKYNQFWPEVKRVLKPGGVFATWGYCWANVDPAIDETVNEMMLKPIQPYWATQNKLLWYHYKDLEIPFEPIASPTPVMTVEWDLHQLFAFMHSWSATRRAMDAIGDDFFNTAFQQVAPLWGVAEQKKKVTFDFFSLLYRR